MLIGYAVVAAGAEEVLEMMSSPGECPETFESDGSQSRPMLSFNAAYPTK